MSLEILSSTVAALSSNFFFHSYYSPRIDPSSLSKLIILSSPIGGVSRSVTISGTCYWGSERVSCQHLSLGASTLRLLPLIPLVYEVFFGLLFVGSLSALISHQAVKAGLLKTKEARPLRRTILIALILADFAGTALASTLGCAVVYLAAMDLKAEGLENVVDLNIGWALVGTIFLSAASGFLTLSFLNTAVKWDRMSPGSEENEYIPLPQDEKEHPSSDDEFDIEMYGSGQIELNDVEEQNNSSQVSCVRWIFLPWWTSEPSTITPAEAYN